MNITFVPENMQYLFQTAINVFLETVFLAFSDILILATSFKNEIYAT